MEDYTIPDSPALPRTEIENIPSTEIPAQLGADLDLADSGDDTNNEDVEMKDADLKMPINNFKQFEHSDSLPSTPELNILSSCVPRDSNYVTPMADFSDPVKAPHNLINPFGANNQLSSSDPIPIIFDGKLNIKKLSDLQEQKLNDYIDEQLLTIQRGFVKYLSSKSENNSEGLEVDQIVHKLDDILEFIWYSIFQIKSIPIAYHTNIIIDSSIDILFHNEELKAEISDIISKSPLLLIKDDILGFKQLTLPSNIENSAYVSYLIRILGDLIDYITKYKFLGFKDWIIWLRLLAKLDNILSVIIDYSNLKSITIISATEKIRISSIIQRTKIALVGLFDQFLRNLGLNNVQKYRYAIDAFQTYVGETYEGLVDRTSL